MLDFLSGGFEVAINADVSVLVETGIRLETGFWLGSAFENTVIVLEETDSPFNAGKRMIMFEGVGKFLGTFDELAVCYASCRPGLGEMVGIELEERRFATVTADNDVLFEMATFFEGIYLSTEEFALFVGHKIANSASGRAGNECGRSKDRTCCFQTQNCLCFQMP